MVDFLLPPSQEELTLEGYKMHQENQKAAPPLTDAEQELKLLKESEVSGAASDLVNNLWRC